MLSIAVAGCQAQGVRTFTVQAVGPPILCTPAQILPFRLVIDLSAADPVWGRWQADDSRFDILWPSGFTLASSPEPALLDPGGKVVARNGQLITDAGGSGGGNGDAPVVICSIGGAVY